MKTMIFAMIATATIAAATATAAQETAATAPEVSPPVAGTETVKAAPAAQTEVTLAIFAAVCASQAILSEKAKAACTANTPPTPVNAGDKFRGTGIGAEFNVINANLALIEG